MGSTTRGAPESCRCRCSTSTRFFAGSPNGKTSVTITNIMGFFIEGMGGPGNKDVIGRLVAIPGLTKGDGSVDETASFLRKVLLVR